MTFLETYIHFIQFLVLCQQIFWYTCRLIVSMAEILRTLNSVSMYLNYKDLYLGTLPPTDD